MARRGAAAARHDQEQASPFSIRVVSSQTGIPIDTLRMWERRYGFPKPARRPGGARLYNHEDITRLRLIARARDAGYRPGDVIALPDRDIAKLIGGSAAPPTLAEVSNVNVSSRGDASASVLGLVDTLLDALKRDDVARLRSSLRTLAMALGPRAFVADIAHPLAVRVGDAWERGELDVRHEHLATALLSMQLRLLLSAFEESENAPVVVLATLPGEAHALGLDMVAVHLAVHGATPRLLGADTPPDQIARAAQALDAQVVGIAISTASDFISTKRHVDQLRRALPRKTELWVGGAGAASVLSHDGNPRRVPKPSSEAGPRVRITTSWQAIDEALLLLRGGGGV